MLLRRALEILVATPGRLLDHLSAAASTCRELQMLVLDEADRMLDMGFIDDIETIVAADAGVAPDDAVLGHASTARSVR